MLKSEKRLESLTSQEEALLAKLKQLREAKKEASVMATGERRKKETRRKVLIGAAILNEIERGEWTNDQLEELMDRFLIRDKERFLFGLPAKPQDSPKPAQTN